MGTITVCSLCLDGLRSHQNCSAFTKQISLSEPLFEKKSNFNFLFKCNMFARPISVTCAKQAVRGCNNGRTSYVVLFDQLVKTIQSPAYHARMQEYLPLGYLELSKWFQTFDKQFLCHASIQFSHR